MKHKYSTVALVVLGSLLLVGAIFAITSEEVDELCSTNGKILKRASGTWACGDDLTGNGSGSVSENQTFHDVNITGELDLGNKDIRAVSNMYVYNSIVRASGSDTNITWNQDVMEFNVNNDTLWKMSNEDYPVFIFNPNFKNLQFYINAYGFGTAFSITGTGELYTKGVSDDGYNSVVCIKSGGRFGTCTTSINATGKCGCS